METLSPLILSTNAFTCDGDGSFAIPPPQSLQNPLRTAMLVDEFRFAIGQDTSDPLKREMSQMLANITYGNSQLTNQSIPLSSFCPTYISGNTQRMLTWHLPKPLYVPPSVPIVVKLSRRNPFPLAWSSTPGTQFIVAISGRSLPGDAPRPAMIPVPWACATTCYSSTWDATANQTPPFTSQPNEIGNPFDTDLYMSYMTGRMTTSSDSNGGSNLPSSPVFVQATYASGKMFIRDPTPWVGLFPFNRPVLRTRGVMKPKDFMKLMLSITPQAAAAANNQLNFSTVGLVGYRMMETPR